MVRFPSLTGHHVRDENHDGRIDERDAARHRERRLDAERDMRPGRTAVAERPTTVEDRGDKLAGPTVVEPAVRPRASGLATLGLVLGVSAAAAVATGVLALPGVAVGLIGLLASVGGVAATGRRHIAGRLDALLGLLLSLLAVVVGLLAVSDAIGWPDTEANQVARLADWLSAELPWLGRF